MHQPPPRRPQGAAPPIAYLALAALVILALYVCVTSLYGQQVALFWRGLEPSCIVGTGAATITVQGWSATADCSAMAAGHDDFTGVSWGAILSPESEASGPIVCERDISGRHLIVREGNPLSDTGAVLCDMIDHVGGV